MKDLLERHRRLERNCQQLRASNKRYLRDVVELKRSNDQLNQALTALTQMQPELLMAAKNAALGSLVAGVSHELSTPVGNSLMAASTIQHQADEFQRQYSDGISRTDMTNFIHTVRVGADMLMRNLGRAVSLMDGFKEIAAGRSGITPCVFDLHDAVGAIVAARLVRHSVHRVINEVPPMISVNNYLTVLGDVLAELIENALRHGFHGHGVGTIRIGIGHQTASVVELVVEDDGVGIVPEHVERIFDPFFTTTLGQGSSGLGLHAVYNMVHATMRGKIAVRSEPARGTRFTITLPL